LNPCTTDSPSLRRIHFSRFPLLPHPIATTTTTSFAAEEKLFYLPFRPTPHLPLPETILPRCASSGNTSCRRRRRSPATGAPAPLLSLSLSLSVLLHGKKERRRKMTGGRRRKKRKRKIKTDRVELMFLPKLGVQSHKLVSF
ncbi:Os12g0275901, partial [Oryza sativa Japonica Group]